MCTVLIPIWAALFQDGGKPVLILRQGKDASGCLAIADGYGSMRYKMRLS